MRFLVPEQCCLYVVDPQERLMAHIHEAGRVVKNIALMIRLAGTFSLPVLANTQYKKGIGPIVPELADLLTGVPCPDKVEFNGLANTEVRLELDRLSPSVDTLLLCGVETHICIYQTAMGALDAGYKVRVVADAVSSRTSENDRFGQARLREIGAVLQPAEMIIYELLRQAGTTEFKVMLPYLK
ncbi:MAG: isochorismatase family protein [Desulfobulbaceae bacterium]|nr:isochorismatase family protein [Desulfobulbaceae bacterium]